MIGQVIEGKFEVLDEIGRGGMGVVYRARQISLDRIVALKVLSGDLVGDDEFHERFRQEAKIIARLNHPNIVQVYDICELEDQDGGICIVMEYIEGRSLRDLMRESGRLDAGRAVDVARQVAAGLAYAHERGIIHRDIKPDNIMMLEDGRAKIADFGIARLRGASLHTRTGTAMGTPQFMSPEQAAGRSVDARTDIYSLGVVLFAMVTGELPFTGDSPVSVALKHIQEPPPRPSSVNPSVPPALETIILKAMAKKPEERFQSAQEFRKALDDFAAGRESAAVIEGEETCVSTPAFAPANVHGPTPATDFRSFDEVPTPRPSARLLNWAWVAAAVPGLIALIIVLVFLSGLTDRNRLRRSDLERLPIDVLISRLGAWQRSNPTQAQRFVRRYEGVLYKRLEKVFQESAKGSGRETMRLRMWARLIASRNLTGEALRRWEKLAGRVGPPRSPGRGRDVPGPRGPFRPSRLEAVLVRLKDEVQPDPARAKKSYDEAEAIFEKVDSIERPEARRSAFEDGLDRLAESVCYDRRNALYNLELARRLYTYANQFPSIIPRKRIVDEVRGLIADAKKYCLDEKERRKIWLFERILRFEDGINSWLEKDMPSVRPLRPEGSRRIGPPPRREGVGRRIPRKSPPRGRGAKPPAGLEKRMRPDRLEPRPFGGPPAEKPKPSAMPSKSVGTEAN